MEEIQLRRMARKRAGFLRHLYIYLIINAFLIVVNLLTPHKEFWALGSIIGWGLGLGIHWYFAYCSTEGKLEEKQYQKLKSKQ